MALSIYLARVFGLYLVIVGIFYLFRRRFIEKVLPEFFEQNSTILITGIINLVLGLLVVVGHNVWIWHWVVVITLLGYLILLKGLVRLFVPDGGDKKLALILSRGSAPIFVGIISLIIGLFLIYEGYLGV